MFATDAEWKIAGMHMRGRQQIRSEFAKFMRHIDRTFMIYGTPIVDIVDGVVTSRTHVTENNKFADGRTASTSGSTTSVSSTRVIAGDSNGATGISITSGRRICLRRSINARTTDRRRACLHPDDPTTVRRDFLFTRATVRFPRNPSRKPPTSETVIQHRTER